MRQSQENRYMRHLTWFGAASLLVVTLMVLLTCSLQGPQVVVVTGNGVTAEAGTKNRSIDAVDHSIWDRLLHKYVDGDGMVNYAAWKASSADRTALRDYLVSLGQVDPDAPATKEGKLAFWINAYNALTIYGILDVYPTSSIRNHTARVFGYNIWKDLLLPVGNRKYSLDAIEHQVLRKLGEPRIHFAVVCASKGCPRLRNEAYTREKLEEQLADNTRDFFARPKNLQVDFAHRAIQVSAILHWFGQDFGPTPREALASLAAYLPNDATRRLILSGDFSVSFLDYDWSLNEQ
ncbi:DUF547 domain-containing protein [Thermogutta sp.]|uniref:DUF547 domain-containing protein n=1 Tax=Thermogutta sp. TaxID=1962930 RepID=UPI003C7A62CF